MHEIKLSFTEAQMKLLDTAISELPYRIAAPLIAQINQQIQKQFDAAVDAKDTPSGGSSYVPADSAPNNF